MGKLQRERPLLATAIGVVFILFGIKEFQEILENNYLDGVNRGVHTLLSSDLLLSIPVILKALFGITAGIGILFGARWSWWFMLVSLFGGLMYDICVLIIVVLHKQKASDFIFIELVKLALGIFLRPLLLLYCFKERVLRFFMVKKNSIRYVVPLLAVTAIFISFYLIYVYILYKDPERLFVF